MENCRPNNVGREEREKKREGDGDILWKKHKDEISYR